MSRNELRISDYRGGGPKSSSVCVVCGLTGAGRCTIQVNWFRGDDVVVSACDKHANQKFIGELLEADARIDAERTKNRVAFESAVDRLHADYEISKRRFKPTGDGRIQATFNLNEDEVRAVLDALGTTKRKHEARA